MKTKVHKLYPEKTGSLAYALMDRWSPGSTRPDGPGKSSWLSKD